MIEMLQNIDESLLLFFNSKNSPFFDALMFSVSSKFLPIPLYIFLIYLLYDKFKAKIWIYILLMIAAVGIADLASVYGFKEVFQRLRPCHNPEINHLIHSVYDKCGGQYGFVSSHATNNFALATIFMLIAKSNYKSIQIFLFIWAALVSFSRVYLGVHYPGDVLGGAALGSIVAIIVYVLFTKIVKKQ